MFTVPANHFLLAALITGLSGSMHCLAMCGGIAGALGLRARAQGGSTLHTALHVSGYQCGRLLSYTLAGALCGAAGHALTVLLDLAWLVVVLRVAAGLLMLALGLQIMLRQQLLGWLEKSAAYFWRLLTPWVHRLNTATAHTGVGHSLLLGAVWGWLPCGLVYSMLMLAALTHSAIQGASMLLLFGLGTLPAMLSTGFFAAQLQRMHRTASWRWLMGSVLMCFGGWTLYIAIHHTGSQHVH